MAAFTTTAVERFIKSGVPVGKPHAIAQGRQRPVPAASADRERPRGSSSTACAALVARARRRLSRSARGLQSTCARRPRKQSAWRAKSPPGRDPRADINEAKRRERAVVAAALDDYEEWTKGRRLRKVADDDVGAAAGPWPSLAARPCTNSTAWP